jgi:hypothetical protein
MNAYFPYLLVCAGLQLVLIATIWSRYPETSWPRMGIAGWIFAGIFADHNYGNVVICAAMVGVWLWLYFKKKPPRKKRRARISGRVKIRLGRLVVSPT